MFNLYPAQEGQTHTHRYTHTDTHTHACFSTDRQTDRVSVTFHFFQIKMKHIYGICLFYFKILKQRDKLQVKRS